MQPGRHRLLPALRTGFTGQDEKDGLTSVLGVVIVAEHAFADTQHHGFVAIQQGPEGCFVALSGELSEQFAVGHLTELLQRGHPPDLIQQEILAVWNFHRVHLVCGRRFSTY